MAKFGKRHFGVLCADINNYNQNEIWRGIAEAAQERDIHLTGYIVTYQTTDNAFSSFMESCVGNIIGSQHIDGVIMIAGYLAQNVGSEKFEEYIARLPKDMPIISISYEMLGIPSVIIDNVKGIYTATEHLIRVHGRKRIAFIKGPDGHPEAEDRLAGYKAALEANGIEIDERYVFPGDFGPVMAGAAVEELYDVRKIPVDAIVCSNDQVAMGAMNALKDRGVKVPADVAVTGFDNDLASSVYLPTIATVGQDFVRMGRDSVTRLLDMVNGKPVDETPLAPEFFARQSCGCFGKDMEGFDADAGAAGDATFAEFIENGFLKALQDVVPCEQIKGWTGSLLSIINETPFRGDAFISELDRILVTYYHSYSKIFTPWHEAVGVLEKGLKKYRGSFDDAYAISSVLAKAATLVYEICLREKIREEYNLSNDRLFIKRMTNDLLLMFDMNTLAEEISVVAKRLNGMNAALIGLYKSPIKRDEPGDRTFETVIGYDMDEKYNIQHNRGQSMTFSDYSTIEGFDFERERRAFFYQPLFYMDEEVGEMLLPYNPATPSDVYETVRVNVSTAVRGAKLLETIHTLSITDELTGLHNRRGFFQFAYSRLHQLKRIVDAVPIVMFMDMDGLKHINDNYGHSEGDKAIAIFADLLKSTIREEDIIGRMGGDEFAAFSSVKSSVNSKQLESRLREAFDNYNAKGLHPYKIAASIGCVVLEQTSKECFDEAILSADNVLYEEKMMKKRLGVSRG